MEGDWRSGLLARYKECSIGLVSRHINDVAKSLCDVLLEDTPYTIPKEHRAELSRLREGLAGELLAKNPHRNTKLRKMYEEIASSSLILLDGPHDETGMNHTELLARWCAYAQQVSEYGFDIGKRIILLDSIINELTDPLFTPAYTVHHLLLQQGIIGSMFTNPPVFTPRWKGAYLIWSFMNAAVDVTDNLPNMRYSGGN